MRMDLKKWHNNCKNRRQRKNMSYTEIHTRSLKKVDNIRVKVEYVVEISNFEIPEELFDEMEIKYFIYHETFDNNGKSFNEAQQMSCASGNKEKVMAYLYGIINGFIHCKRSEKYIT